MTSGFGQLHPWRVEPKARREAEAVHHLPVPGIRVVFERFLDEAAVTDAPLRIRNQQFRMSELVDSEAAACATRAFGIVEHEIGRADAAIYKMMRPAAQRCVKSVLWSFDHLDLHQTVTH